MTEDKVKIVTPLLRKWRRDGGEGRSCVAVTTNSSVGQIWLTDDAVERNVSDGVYLLLYGCRSRSQDDGTIIIIVTKETKLYFYLSAQPIFKFSEMSCSCLSVWDETFTMIADLSMNLSQTDVLLVGCFLFKWVSLVNLCLLANTVIYVMVQSCTSFLPCEWLC